MNTKQEKDQCDQDDFNKLLICLDSWEPTFNGVDFNQIVTCLDDLGLNFDGWNFDFDDDDDQLFLERKTDQIENTEGVQAVVLLSLAEG